MTQPDQLNPEQAANYDSLAAWAEMTEIDWRNKYNAPYQTALDQFTGGFFGGLPTGMPHSLAMLTALIRKLIGNPFAIFPSAEEALDALFQIPIIGDLLSIVFRGTIPRSWISDVIEDLISGAGQFINALSVSGNPFLQWDPAKPGWHSGGSAKMTANGTQQSARSEIFNVVPGQILELPAGTMWSSLTATPGTNPIKVGFATWDANKNPLPDVITGQLQPPAANGIWQAVPSQPWKVESGVAFAAPLLMLDAGATSGDVWFSNVLPHMSNKINPLDLQSILEGGNNIGEDIQNTWNSFWNGVFGGNATGKTPDDVKAAAGHVTSVASDASAAAQFAASMVIRPRRSPRWISTGTHDDVSFPIISAQSMFTPALNDITYIPITPDTDRVYKALKFGLVGSAMTNCYVGVYKIETDGTLTLAVNLGDKKSSLTASKVQTFAIPGGVGVGRGETVFIAVRQVGGTAGQMFTTPSLLQVTEVVQPLPTYPTEKNNTGSGLPGSISGAIVRSESAPAWGALGETLLDSPWTDFSTAGTHSFLIPTDARYIYIIGSSAGGGGGGGDGGWNKPGEGGRRGLWAAVSLERGVGIPWDVTELEIYLPAGGAGAPGREQNGSAGGALNVHFAGSPSTVLLNIPGGAAGRLAYGGFFNRDPVGEAQVNYPFFGRLFVGGLAAAMDTNGNPPGGGGGGGDGGVGGSANGGRPGGSGFCAIRTA